MNNNEKSISKQLSYYYRNRESILAKKRSRDNPYEKTGIVALDKTEYMRLYMKQYRENK